MLANLSPGLQKRAMPLSVAAWHGMIRDGLAPARAELIRGVIVEKMSKSFLHTQLCGALMDHLLGELHDSHWVRKEEPLTFHDTEPEPDISIVPGKRQDYRAHPSTAELVVEVSVSTLAEDRGMADIYAEAGVAEFWIVNAPGRCIEVYRKPGPGGYAEKTTWSAGQTLTCASLPVSIDVATLFSDLPA